MRRALALLASSFAVGRERPLIDLRGAGEFAAKHVAGSTHIPLRELKARTYELPAPFEAPLGLCAGSEGDLEAARELLEASGWTVERDLLVVAPDWGGLPTTEEGCVDSTRIWRPSAFLADVLGERLTGGHLPATGIALDLGCGSGRDAVHLALELGPGWRVLGLDNHQGALDRAAALAEREGVGATTEFRNVDLRAAVRHGGVGGGGDLGGLAEFEGRVDFVHGCRFFARDLVACARDRLLRREGGATFVWSTFMEGTNLAPPFRKSRRLLPGEMREAFGGAAAGAGGGQRFRVLRDEEGVLTTRRVGVPASFFAAEVMGV